MLLRTRIYAAIIGLAVMSPLTIAQEQADPVQKLIRQYEIMSDKERVAFLQAIALIGINKTESPPPQATTPVVPMIPVAIAAPPEAPPATPAMPPSLAPATPNLSPTPTTNSVPSVVSEPAPTVQSEPKLMPQIQAPAVQIAAPPSPVAEQPPENTAVPVAAPSQPGTPTLDKPQTTVQINLPEPIEPHPDADIQTAVAPPPVKLLDMPQPTPPVIPTASTSVPNVSPTPATNANLAAATPTPRAEPIIQPAAISGFTRSIRIIVSQHIDYGFTGAGNPANSVFGLLLPEYQQKLNDAATKVEVDDLRKETISFYVSNLESKLSDCGYQVIRNSEPTLSEMTALQLETGIQRIVINKTLFETALIGEATAKLSSKQQELTKAQARTTKAIPQFDNATLRSGELKTTLSQTVDQLSSQVASKICSVALN